MKGLALASLVLVSLLAGPVRAQPAPEDETAANALVEQAAHAYDQNQLDQAVQLLSRAYELSPRPSILYNRAQVLRAKDDCAAALDDYRRFADATAADDPNHERALHRRDEMQSCVDQRKPPAPPVKLAVEDPPQPPAPAPAVVLSAPEAPEQTVDRPVSRRRALRAAGWAAVGVGIVAAGVAGYFQWQAHQIAADLAHPPAWGPGQKSQYMEGQNDATRAAWLAGVAGLAGAGGVALFIISRPPDAGSSSVALVGWSGNF